jgi:flagellar basal-body rod modification protein FlgD
MNPMDNAQMTSQIAQINTVTGIQQLNSTVKSMSQQFSSMQMLQSSSMVGRDVLTEGNSMARTGDTAAGIFDLADDATAVKVEVVTPGGVVLDTLNLGPMKAGNHGFTWDTSAYANADLTFKVSATNGADAITATPYMRDKVLFVSMEGGALSLELQSNGPVAYNKIKAVL